ncbi:MAG: sigma-54-dependent Fis family transcriptional regulator [Deltaproteobacteria bacterium]|nr:sigma-54-dependent Fis family transcriptional regulator [Deltaproteobacteria bacterium]
MDMILVVDDNKDTCRILSDILESEGYRVATANDARTAIKGFEQELPDLVLLDRKLPDMDGLKALEVMRTSSKDLAVIMLTAYGDVKSAVMAMKLGAFDYITKPFAEEDLSLIIRKALEMRRLMKHVPVCFKRGEVMPVKGGSSQIKQVLKQVCVVAPTKMTVILQGESGTGKELIARLIHEKSPRKEGPFIAIDCGTIQNTLAESELFGYEKGAFTGADGRKDGQFELAHGGTLFLDEVTNLSESIQAKLLRVLQERKVHRLGGKKDREIDVRIIVAANVNISEEARGGKFRGDLYHRLNEFTIEIPPLRERREDITVLAGHFMDEANVELNKKVSGFSSEATEALLNYNWPGNIRELRNVVRRAVLQTGPDHVITQVLPMEPVKESPEHGLQTLMDTGVSLKAFTIKTTMDIERALIKEALRLSKNNKSRAARLLKIDRVTLYSKIRSLRLE